MRSDNLSPIAIIAAIVAIIGIVTAAGLFISTNDAGVERFALILGISSLALPQLVGMLRSEQASNSLNGQFDERVVQAVLRANFVRRVSDVTPEAAAPVGREAIDNPTTTTIPESS